jgi:hypothetical protein
MHCGFTMRQQCVAAINAKALRLNAAAVSHISNGHIVNLVSNDVRRFDDAMPFWCVCGAFWCVCGGTLHLQCPSVIR